MPARVLDWLEEWLQTEWPELRVYCTSVTEQWATIAVVGPKSRAVVAAVAPDLDVSKEGFPFLTFRETVVAGVPARVCRISFSGELAYELNVSAWHAPALWAAILQAGAPHGITRYGTEALHVLRAEKGYVIVGQETDGAQTPDDLGMGRMVSPTKTCVGQRSLSRSAVGCPGRKQLVGLLPMDPETRLPEGAPIIEPGAGRTPPVPMLGHITSKLIGRRHSSPISPWRWSPTEGPGSARRWWCRSRPGTCPSGSSTRSCMTRRTCAVTADPRSLRRSPLDGASHGDAGRCAAEGARPFLAAVDLRLPLGGPAAPAVETVLGASLPTTVGRGAPPVDRTRS